MDIISLARRFPIIPFVVVLAVGVAQPARAADFVSAGLGVSFANSGIQSRPSFAGAFGFLPRDRQAIGAEIDVTYAPSFFRNSGGFTEDRLTTVMADLLVVGSGRDHGRRFRTGLRPYVSAGVGLMSERVDAGAGGVISDDHIGFDIGAGVMAVSRRSLGIRADIRYFQDLVGDSGSVNGVSFGSFHFWRASIGFVAGF